MIFPATLNDTLLSCAQLGLYRPLWSERILQELHDSMVRAYPHLNPQSIESRVCAMRRAFPHAMVTGWRSLERESAPVLPDPHDAHVVAAARKARAEFIVTDNLTDFPAEILALWGLVPMSADTFLVRLWHSNPAGVSNALWAQSERMINPPLSVDQLLDRLARTVPEFCRTVSRTFDA